MRPLQESRMKNCGSDADLQQIRSLEPAHFSVKGGTIVFGLIDGPLDNALK